jgi:hypothetical protein
MSRISRGAPPVIEDVVDADWAPDGSQLAIVRRLQGGDRLELPAGKTLYESPGWIRSPRFSPRGDRIAFVDDHGGISVVDLTSRKTVLATGHSAWGQVAWSPSGRELRCAASDSAFSVVRELRSVGLSGRSRVLWRAFGLWL